MRLATKKEFAEKCGMPTNGLSVFISRNKVVLLNTTADACIDADDPINVLFYENRLAKGKVAGEQAAPVAAAKETAKPVGKKVKVASAAGNKAKGKAAAKGKKAAEPVGATEEVPQEAQEAAPVNNLDALLNKREMERLQIQEKKLALEKLQIDLDKKNGLLIPKEPIMMLVKQFAKSIQASYRAQMEDMIVQVGEMTDITPEQVALLRKKLIDGINDAVTDSVKDANKNIAGIVAEYSDKRGVGEHE